MLVININFTTLTKAKGNSLNHSVMVKTKDISIGKDKWITWVELDIDHNDSFDIDSLLEPTKEFWQNLETECD